MKKLGFTLIEMLVVISIIGILLSVSAIAYTQVTKSSRDAKRKADLEQLRGALEQYRATNDVYPNVNGEVDQVLGVLIAPVKYMESLPSDPRAGQTGVTDYQYACTDTSNGVCNLYRLDAYLENPVTTYSVTPYGVVQGGAGNGMGSP